MFLIFLVFGVSLPSLSGSLVFPFSVIPHEFTSIYGLCLSALFILAASFSYKNSRFKKYWQILFAFFIASFAISVDLFLNLPSTDMNGIALDMLLSTLIIASSLIVLTKISGNRVASIFLTKGRIKLGLIVGLVGFFVFWGLSIPGATYLFQGKT